MDNRVFRTGNIRVVIVEDGTAAGELAAQLAVTRLVRNPRLAVALPTGKTPLPMYRALVSIGRQGSVDFSMAHIFNLDEIVGLSSTHPASYAAYLRREFLSHVNASSRRTHLLKGGTRNPRLECGRCERRIHVVGDLDLAILGIGRNGHIAFNEPGSPLFSRTRTVQLTPETVEDNDLAWLAPRVHGLTMGIGTILQAREVILLASGVRKAGIVAQALQGPLSTTVPASALRLHPNVTAILDRQAAEELDLQIDGPGVENSVGGIPGRNVEQCTRGN